MPRAKAAPKPKKASAPRGRPKGTAGGRKGSAVPRKAPIHSRKVTHPAPKSHRYHPDGRHMPEEMAGGFTCHHCGHAGWREHRVVTKEGAMHATLAFKGCTSCGTMHVGHVGMAAHANHANAQLRRKIGKTVDTTETAVLPADAPDLIGHRKACPRGGDGPCGAEKKGRCTRCDAPVRDHEALGKSQAQVLDLRKLAGLS